MEDPKTWLEKNSESIKFADTSWKKPPSYPYGVFLDDCTTRGADDRLCIADHDLTVELYAELETSLETAKASIEALFIERAMAFESLGRVWIESERHWQQTYTLSYTEKF